MPHSLGFPQQTAENGVVLLSKKSVTQANRHHEAWSVIAVRTISGTVERLDAPGVTAKGIAPAVTKLCTELHAPPPGQNYYLLAYPVRKFGIDNDIVFKRVDKYVPNSEEVLISRLRWRRWRRQRTLQHAWKPGHWSLGRWTLVDPSSNVTA